MSLHNIVKRWHLFCEIDIISYHIIHELTRYFVRDGDGKTRVEDDYCNGVVYGISLSSPHELLGVYYEYRYTRRGCFA